MQMFDIEEHKRGRKVSRGIRRTAPGAKKFEIYEALKPVIVKNEDGTCSYVDGQNDASIAELMDCSPNSVATIRQDNFGKLRMSQTKAKAANNSEARIAIIEDFLARKLGFVPLSKTSQL